jgi:SAM-dependent methyltransferase
VTNTKTPSERYFLPEGYRTNPVATTRDSEREDVYWNPNRWRNALYYQYPVYKYCANLIKKTGANRIVDVGCCCVVRKLEMLHRRFRQLEIVGIDQEEPIQTCRRNYSFGRWIADDLENPGPEVDGLQADLVVCSDVIEHVLDPDVLLEYLRARCRAGGRIVISTPDRERLYGLGKLAAGQRDHVREWSGVEFSSYLAARGMDIEERKTVSPGKMGLNSVFFREALKQLRPGRQYRYNQICTVRV